MITYQISFDDYLKMCDAGFWEWMREQDPAACVFRVDQSKRYMFVVELPDTTSAVTFKLRWL